MEEGYASQEKLILQRAHACGLASEEVNAYFDEKLEEVASIHSSDHNVKWKLARVEYLVWEHFCKTNVVFLIIKRVEADLCL
jgi:hypothetical protein